MTERLPPPPPGFEIIPPPPPGFEMMAPEPAPAGPGPSLGRRVLDRAGEVARDAAGFADGMARQVARGASFGLIDEAAAGANAALGIGAGREGYDAALAAERARDRDFERRHPYAAVAGQVGGGAAVPLRLAGTAATLPGAMLRGGTAGAVTGGVTGFGEGEGGLVPRATSAGIGAVAGGGIGGLVPGLVAGGGLAVDRIQRGMGGPAPSQRYILRDIQRDGMTPEDLARAAREAGDSPVGLVDLAGENMRQSAQVVARTPGAGREMAARMIEGRGGARAAERQQDIVRRHVSAEDFDREVTQTAVERGMRAERDYAAAYDRVLPRDLRLQRFLNDPEVSEGVRAGIASARREALTNDQAFDPASLGIRFDADGSLQLVRDGMPTRLFDTAQRGLSEMEQTALAAGNRTRAREIGNLRRALLTEVDRLNPEFRAARENFSGASRMIDAARDGRALLRAAGEDADEVVGRIRGMTAGEREFARIGLAREMIDTVRRTPDGQETRRLMQLFGSPETRDRLRMLFDSDDAYRAFAADMQRELRMATTNRTIAPNGGSPTMPMAERNADMARPPAGPVAAAFLDPERAPRTNLLAAIAGGPAGIARRVGETMENNALVQMRERLAPHYFTTDPAARQRLAEDLIRRALRDQATGNLLAPFARSAQRGGAVAAGLAINE